MTEGDRKVVDSVKVLRLLVDNIESSALSGDLTNAN